MAQNRSNSASLRRRRDVTLRKLPPMEAILRGSLVERYLRCGKAGCRCAGGVGHGPKHYLSVSLPGRRPEMLYVPKDLVERVRELLENHRLLKELVETISEVNRELLRRGESP